MRPGPRLNALRGYRDSESVVNERGASLSVSENPLREAGEPHKPEESQNLQGRAAKYREELSRQKLGDLQESIAREAERRREAQASLSDILADSGESDPDPKLALMEAKLREVSERNAKLEREMLRLQTQRHQETLSGSHSPTSSRDEGYSIAMNELNQMEKKARVEQSRIAHEQRLGSDEHWSTKGQASPVGAWEASKATVTTTKDRTRFK